MPSRQWRKRVRVLGTLLIIENPPQSGLYQRRHGRAPSSCLFPQSLHHGVIYVQRGLHMEDHISNMARRQRLTSMSSRSDRGIWGGVPEPGSASTTPPPQTLHSVQGDRWHSWGGQGDRRRSWGVQSDRWHSWDVQGDRWHSWDVQSDRRHSWGVQSDRRRSWGVQGDRRRSWGVQGDRWHSWGVQSDRWHSWGGQGDRWHSWGGQGDRWHSWGVQGDRFRWTPSSGQR